MRFIWDFLDGVATAFVCFLAVTIAGILAGTQIARPVAQSAAWTRNEEIARSNAPNILAAEHPCSPQGTTTLTKMTVTGETTTDAHIWSLAYVCQNGRTGTILWNPREIIIKATPEPDYPVSETTPTPDPAEPTP